MSLGYHAVIREPLSTGCLYVQSAHVDYLQALGFPAAKASSGCLTNPSSEHCHTVKSALCWIPCCTFFPLQWKPDIFQIGLSVVSVLQLYWPQKQQPKSAGGTSAFKSLKWSLVHTVKITFSKWKEKHYKVRHDKTDMVISIRSQGKGRASAVCSGPSTEGPL